MKHLRTLVIISLSLVLFSSCIKKEYDLDNLDLNIKVGGDSLYIPIGSTDTIRLSAFIDTADIDLLSILGDGGYGIQLKDSIGIDIPTIDTNTLKVDDIVEESRQTVKLDIPVDNLKIPGISISQSVPISQNPISLDDIAIPNFFKSVNYPTGLASIPKPPVPITVPIPEIPVRINENIDFNFSFDIPGEINSVDSILLKRNSVITITLAKQNFPDGIITKVDSLQIIFPPQLTFGAHPNITNNVYLLVNTDFSSNTLAIEIPLQNIDLTVNPINNGVIAINEVVEITGKYSISGELNSSELPADQQSDAKVNIVFQSRLAFESADVHINDIFENIPASTIPLHLTAALDQSIDSIGQITVDNATISVSLNVPTIAGTSLQTGNDGIRIQFPQKFRFAPTAGLDVSTNIYTIMGVIPPNFALTLDTLNVNTKLNEDGVLNINEEVRISGGIKIPGIAINSKDFVSLSNQNVGIQASIPDIAITTISLGGISTQVNDSVYLDFTFTDMPSEIKALDSILFADAVLELSLTLNQTVFGGKNLQGSLILELPEMIKFRDGEVSNNILKEVLVFKNNTWSKTLHVKSLAFNDLFVDGSIRINEKVKVRASLEIINPTIDINEIIGQEIIADIAVSLKNVKFDKIYGQVDPDIEAQHFSFDLSDLPDIMKGDDMILDIDNPYITLQTSSNLGIPLEADIDIIPWKHGFVLDDLKQSIKLELDRTLDPTQNMINKFWLAKSSNNIPSDYKFVGIDLTNLFKRIPDSVQFAIKPGTNTEVQHVFDFNAQYNANVDYNVTVPFAFGKDLKIVLRDTMGDFDSTFSEMIFAGREIALFGEIYNTIPLDLELTVIPIDIDGNTIPIEFPQVRIKSGQAGGGETKSEMHIAFNDPDKLMVHLKSFVLNFKVTTENAPLSEPIKPTDYVRAKLKAKLIGGITIDLNDN